MCQNATRHSHITLTCFTAVNALILQRACEKQLIMNFDCIVHYSRCGMSLQLNENNDGP